MIKKIQFFSIRNQSPSRYIGVFTLLTQNTVKCEEYTLNTVYFGWLMLSLSSPCIECGEILSNDA